jgi:hypothetical protein
VKYTLLKFTTIFVTVLKQEALLINSNLILITLHKYQDKETGENTKTPLTPFIPSVLLFLCIYIVDIKCSNHC